MSYKPQLAREWMEGTATYMGEKLSTKAAIKDLGNFVENFIEAPFEHGSAALDAMHQGNIGAMLYNTGRFAIDVVPAVAALKYARVALTVRTVATAEIRTFTGYVGIDKAGITRYVGITERMPAIRFGEHTNAIGSGKEFLRYESVTQNLTKIEARVWEQGQINTFGFQKNGGVLLNKINSIAPKNWQKYGVGYQ